MLGINQADVNKKPNGKGHSKILPGDYQPRRFGLKYNPPMIVLEYLIPSNGKLYHHRMRVHKLEKTSKIEDITYQLIKRHAMYLNHSKISSQQIEELVVKLYEHQFGKFADIKNEEIKVVKPIEKPFEKVNEKIDYNNYDLNKLSDVELEKHKQKMEELFIKNNKDPKAHDFVYDLEVDFKPSQANAEWDEDDEDDDENNDF